MKVLSVVGFGEEVFENLNSYSYGLLESRVLKVIAWLH